MDIGTILLFIFLLICSAFFSSTEIALMSIPKHKVEALLRAGKWGSKQLQQIKEHTDRLLVTILVWNNLINTCIATLATKIALDFARSSGFPEATTIAISTGIITFVLITFGEIIPKSFGSKNPESFALMSAPLYKMLVYTLFPVVVFFEYIIRIFTGKGRHNTMSDEELESFIDLGKDTGTIDESEHKKLIGVLELDNLTAEDIMTPRVDINGISDEKTVADAIVHFMEHEHSRIPVYNESVDKIHSFITIRELFILKERGESQKRLSQIKLHKVYKIPLNQPLDRLLELLQKNNKHMAIVLDEYGGVAGLLTLEDIIEEVFGEIRDETDDEVDEIREISPDVLMVDPDVMIDEILEVYDLELYHIGLDVKEFSSETLGYILTHKLERFPHTGEVVEFPIVVIDERAKNISQMECKVIDIDEGKIGQVQITFIRKI